MFRIRCRYTQARMTAYIKKDLPAFQRRYMARHIDKCPHCHALHRQQASIAKELEIELPRLGTPTRPQLDKMWSNIQTQLANPPIIQTPHTRWQYGMVAVMMLVLLTVPFMVGSRNLDANAIEQNLPVNGATLATASTATADTAMAIAYVSQTEPANGTLLADLQNTPDPNASR
jgi:hypothetical protein